MEFGGSPSFLKMFPKLPNKCTFLNAHKIPTLDCTIRETGIIDKT